jgi:predicted metal-dependent hydrolase
MEYTRDMMVNVSRRLRATDTGTVTVGTENEIIDSLREMIEALKKARKENQNKPSQPGNPNNSPQNQPLLEELAELKMIRNMQMRVNRQTELHGKEYQGEQAPSPQSAKPEEREKYEILLKEHKNLAEKQEKIYQVTNNLYRGKNK